MKKHRKILRIYTWENPHSEEYLIEEEATEGFTESFDTWMSVPTEEQLSSAHFDEHYKETIKMQSENRKRVSHCIDCSKLVPYKTKPFKRCPECKKRFERERVRAARA